MEVSCKVNNTESPDIIKKAVNSILEGITIEYKHGAHIIGKSNNLEVLNIIYNQVRDRSITAALNRLLLRNLHDSSTWFYVNKQVATKGIIVLVEDESESPLGPIRIHLKSNNIERIIEWLCTE
ncbi:MAG TPA: RNA-binding domain-containing protein [Nitrososphaeraceae archaeon]|nr:RNA-binding domain-containing protein [Nitrososphaeraceae archaeon]